MRFYAGQFTIVLLLEELTDEKLQSLIHVYRQKLHLCCPAKGCKYLF